MKLIVIVLAATAAMAVAAATDADAETVSPEAAALVAATRAPSARQAPVFQPRYDGERPVRIPGVAQTAVDARLSDAGDVMGSLGFMCGLKPGAEKYGAAAARGYDDTGRFVGAKVRVAFR